jgi:hypothetical protein
MSEFIKSDLGAIDYHIPPSCLYETKKETKGGRPPLNMEIFMKPTAHIDPGMLDGLLDCLGDDVIKTPEDRAKIIRREFLDEREARNKLIKDEALSQTPPEQFVKFDLRISPKSPSSVPSAKSSSPLSSEPLPSVENPPHIIRNPFYFQSLDALFQVENPFHPRSSSEPLPHDSFYIVENPYYVAPPKDQPLFWCPLMSHSSCTGIGAPLSPHAFPPPGIHNPFMHAFPPPSTPPPPSNEFLPVKFPPPPPDEFLPVKFPPPLPAYPMSDKFASTSTENPFSCGKPKKESRHLWELPLNPFTSTSTKNPLSLV